MTYGSKVLNSDKIHRPQSGLNQQSLNLEESTTIKMMMMMMMMDDR